jgi:hypothetical protein
MDWSPLIGAGSVVLGLLGVAGAISILLWALNRWSS